MLEKYEELNLTAYVESNPDLLVLADIRNKELKEQIESMTG